MVNSVSAQTAQFLYSALLGIGIGVLFDITRLLRSYMPKKRVATALLDLLFWCVAIISLLAFVLTVCDGKMRWYVLIGAFCGCFVYMAALSEIVFKVMAALVAVVRKALFLITRPVYLFLRCIWRGVKKAGRGAEKSIRDKKNKHMKKRKAGKNGVKKAKRAQEPVS